MEAFSLLKYWKSTSNGGENGVSPQTSLTTSAPTSSTSTIVTAASDAHDSDTTDDDGPFFDLEFTVPTEDEDEEEEEETDNDEENNDEKEAEEIYEELEVESEERELEGTNLTLSPSDDLFFKGRIVSIDATEVSSENKSVQFPIPVSLVKSATKFRVFLTGLKRSKSKSKQQQCLPLQSHNHNNKNKFFAVRFKIDDVPVLSLLTRASSNSNNSVTNASDSLNGKDDEKRQKQPEKSDEKDEGEKKNTLKKEVVQKYLKMVKPLYVKVSKKATAENEKEKKEKNMSQKQRLNLKVMAKKHLGKSKSAVVHSMVQSNNHNNINSDTTTSFGSSSSCSKKRDDSLVQQQDGIQSAILHCKRSFNSYSSKDFFNGEEASSVLLTQLVAESLNEKEKTME